MAIGAVAGALVGCLTDVVATDALAASVAAFSLALVADRRRVRDVLLVGGLAGLTMAEGAIARDGALDPPLARLARRDGGQPGHSGPVLVSGRIAADAAQADGSVGLPVDVEWVQDEAGLHAVSGRVQAYVAGELAHALARQWTAGRPVRLRATLGEPRRTHNPGGPSPRWQALVRRHVLTASVKSGLLVDVESGPIWYEAAAAVRREVRLAVARHIANHDSQSAAVVTAILIGDRAGLAPDVERRLQVAGTYHVIAISGGNVALLTALCFFALRRLVGSRRLVATLTAAVVVGYGWTVGDDPSVLRAVTAACLVLGVHALGLTPRPVHLVSAVALMLVVWRPLLVVDVGAWLSFGATLGIVVCAGRLVRWADARLPAGTRRLHRAVFLPLSTLLAATISAEAALLPVQASVFSRVGLAGLALNFIAIPAMACVQLAGLATVVLSYVSGVGAAAAGVAAHGAAVLLLGSARLVDYLPWLSVGVPPPPLAWTAGYYTCLTGFVTAGPGHVRRRLSAGGLALSAVAILTAPTLERAAPSSGMLRVTLVDVGQGDAVLVQFPDRHVLLVDAGGSGGSFDVGRRLVTPTARALGVRRLDWLLVTHPDLDHAGGAASVVDDLDPVEVWEGIAVPGNAPRARLRAVALRRGLVWRTVRAGHRLDAGGVSLDVLHPPEPDWERRAVRNDDSVVVRLRYGDVELLLTGDAGIEFESAWAAPDDFGPFRVLKVGHHGSRSSTSERFAMAYAPDVAIVSAGRDNFFGHPHPDVLARLVGARAAVFRTDLDGAVIVETDGRRVDVRAMSGRHYRLERLPGPS